MSEKIYIGSGKEMNGNYGAFHKLNFSAQDLETLKQNLNQKGYVNVVLNKRQSPSQYGDTHSMTVDLWEPQNQSQAPQQQQPQNFQPQQNQTYQTENVQPPPFNQAPPAFQQPQQYNQPGI